MSGWRYRPIPYLVVSNKCFRFLSVVLFGDPSPKKGRIKQNWAKKILTPCKNWRTHKGNILPLFRPIILASCAFFQIFGVLLRFETRALVMRVGSKIGTLAAVAQAHNNTVISVRTSAMLIWLHFRILVCFRSNNSTAYSIFNSKFNILQIEIYFIHSSRAEGN